MEISVRFPESTSCCWAGKGCWNFLEGFDPTDSDSWSVTECSTCNSHAPSGISRVLLGWRMEPGLGDLPSDSRDTDPAGKEGQLELTCSTGREEPGWRFHRGNAAQTWGGSRDQSLPSPLPPPQPPLPASPSGIVQVQEEAIVPKLGEHLVVVPVHVPWQRAHTGTEFPLQGIF